MSREIRFLLWVEVLAALVSLNLACKSGGPESKTGAVADTGADGASSEEAGAGLKSTSTKTSTSTSSSGSTCPYAGATWTETYCGKLEGVKDPIDPLPAQNSYLSATANRTEDGGVEVVVNPVIQGSSGKIEETLIGSDVVVKAGDQEIKTEDLFKVNPDYPVATDIVFVLDTTGSMQWAIGAVKVGIKKIVDEITEWGFRPKIGGIEFGDGVRSTRDLTDVETFKKWVSGLKATGGGDLPENPLEALTTAHKSFKFRKHAQKYFILITDTGFHEKGDGTSCSKLTLKQAAKQLGGDVFLAVVHAQLYKSGMAGVSPKALVQTMGGIYFSFNVVDAVVESDFEFTANLSGGIRHTHVVKIKADALPAGAKTLALTVKKGDDTETLQVPIADYVAGAKDAAGDVKDKTVTSSSSQTGGQAGGKKKGSGVASGSVSGGK